MSSGEAPLSSKQSVTDFLRIAEQFQLGVLDTEAQHPKTLRLSHWAKNDLTTAIGALKEVDREALQTLRERADALVVMSLAIRDTLESGGRLFLVGCGATGRLSLSIERFCLAEGLIPEAYAHQVIGFMAGGDAALIRSIESFEDRPDYGERQLVDLGFREGDLLIASTEGGETPFVIGATEAAVPRSRRPPFFLHGNPDEQLRRSVERSRRVLENPAICKINLAVGPMALSGSTRMQSSTVLMAAIAVACEAWGDAEHLRMSIDRFRDWFEATDFSFLQAFIEFESAAYEKGEFVLYEPGLFGITVLTDTTERSPTFALVPFENERNPTDLPCLCYLHLSRSKDAAAAWHALLHREPRALEWGALSHLTGRAAMLGFDFSEAALEKRLARTHGAIHHRFTLSATSDKVTLSLGPLSHGIGSFGQRPVYQHLLLKILLNTHSTLVMGRLGRYEDNLMTYVSASNNKLIDRAIRYVRLLLARHHQLEPSYEVVAEALFKTRETLQPNEPIVVKTVERILKSQRMPLTKSD